MQEPGNEKGTTLLVVLASESSLRDSEVVTNPPCEIRLRRVKRRISFHIATKAIGGGSNISQFPQGNYFTFGVSRIFH
jgi:hypothetical protein